MYKYETDLHQGVHVHLSLTDANQTASCDVLNNGMPFVPVFVEQFRTLPQVGNVHSVDPELLYSEDKLGCARGVIWAFVFEAAIITAIAIFWKLRFSLR
jgi:hypothetical protein